PARPGRIPAWTNHPPRTRTLFFVRRLDGSWSCSEVSESRRVLSDAPRRPSGRSMAARKKPPTLCAQGEDSPRREPHTFPPPAPTRDGPPAGYRPALPRLRGASDAAGAGLDHRVGGARARPRGRAARAVRARLQAARGVRPGPRTVGV